MTIDLKMIKKKYGEKMMHLCRESFHELLETPGLLEELMQKHFEPSKELYSDIVKNNKEKAFQIFIYSLLKKETKEKVTTTKTPEELLENAGYILYECKAEEEIQQFKKYYAIGEELCTFKDERLKRCHVFFAVKKEVDSIRRENYQAPNREDEYGTSVLSIQFTKGTINILSIKNRYNHTVANPDATFSNNLDNIIPGLTDSFERKYNLNLAYQKTNFYLPGYIQAKNGKLYKYNYEINNVYYCPNNIIIDNFEVIDKYSAKERYIVADYFIIDLSTKKIEIYDKNLTDSFLEEFKNIEKITVTKTKQIGEKILEFTTKKGRKIILKLNKDNQIIEYKNDNTVKLGDNFLHKNETLNKLETPALIEVGDNFLASNTKLNQLDLPNLKIAGQNFLFRNTEISNINLPLLLEAKDNFLYSNLNLTSIELPNITRIGNNFLRANYKMTKINFPLLLEVKDNFLYSNMELEYLNLPKIRQTGDYFLYSNSKLKELTAPKLESVGRNFLYCNLELLNLELENLTKVEDNFMCSNQILITLNLPKLTKLKDNFLRDNKNLKSINITNITKIGNNVLMFNTELESIIAPNLINIGNNFLTSNKKLTMLEMPSIIQIGNNVLYSNENISTLSFPSLTIIGQNFLKKNTNIIYVYLPSIQEESKSRLSYLIQEKINQSITSFYPNQILEIKIPTAYNSKIINTQIADKKLKEIIEVRLKTLKCNIQETEKTKSNKSRRTA